MLIAAQCPTPTASGDTEGDNPPQPPYQRVVRLYANAFLRPSTPLHTMALAFSGQAAAAIKHGGKSLTGGLSGFTRAASAVGQRGAVLSGSEAGDSASSGDFEGTWMATAAAILSNRV